MSPLNVIQRWEDLGQQLEKAVAAYLEACANLELCTPSSPTGPYDLVSLIDRRLNSFPTLLSQRLASAHSSITRTRNKLVAPVLRLPDEILSGIFRLAIHSIDVEEPSQLGCKYTINVIYKRLHTFMGICSAWRRVGLDNRFWSLVPVVDQPSGRHMTTAAQLSLTRAANRRLHFAACHIPRRPDIDDFIIETLSQHGLRFDSVNLCSSSGEFLVRSINALAESEAGNQSSVKDLSLWYSSPGSLDPQTSRRPPPFAQPFLDHLLSEAFFEHVMESLQVLQICGFNIPLKEVSLRNLIKLKLQEVVLGSKQSYSQFLRALGASSQLRTLEIISVLITPGLRAYSVEGLPISVPSLKHLYLEDLSFDGLEFTLESITAGSHLVTLNWTRRCFKIMGNETWYRSASDLDFRRFKIDALMLRREWCKTVYPDPVGHVVYFLLEAMPTITSLYLDGFALNPEILRELTPQAETQSREEIYKELHQDRPEFPKLENLYISRSHCHGLETLHYLSKVVASHPLEELGIGIGVDCECELDSNSRAMVPCQDDIDREVEFIWRSLGDVVPRLVRLPRKAAEMPAIAEFENHIWKL